MMGLEWKYLQSVGIILLKFHSCPFVTICNHLFHLLYRLSMSTVTTFQRSKCLKSCSTAR